MARLASQAKAGFYPTPDTVCELLGKKLNFEEGARILDPCCGKGNILNWLAGKNPEVATYGIELDHLRTQEARSRLHHVLWGDALCEIILSAESFGMLLLNPPYDNAAVREEIGKSQRMEVQFLRRYLGVLQQDGLLILIIPWYVLRDCAQPLGRYFDLEVFCFPKEEFQKFGQCVVLGRKRKLRGKADAEKTELYLKRLAERRADDFLAEVPSLAEIGPDSITIEAARKPFVNFRAKKVDPLEAIPRIRKAAILHNLLEELAPRKNNEIRPLLPLENGHLALMLAGGYMNGAIEKDGKQLVIKGLVRKSEQIMNADQRSNRDTVMTKDKYTPTVKVIDMKSAELLVVQ